MPATDDQIEAAVLTDSRGNYYVIPLDVLERTRVPDAQKAEIDAAFGGDVTGYAMTQAPLGGSIARVDGRHVVDETVEPWPAVEQPRRAGYLSALRSLLAARGH
jgi:hypothetical protein